MDKIRSYWPQLAVFWAVTITATVLTWRFLPTRTAQIAYSLLLLFAALSALFRNGRLAGLAAMFFVLMSVNYWLLDDSINGIIGGVCIIAATVATGYWAINIEQHTEHFSLAHWLFLGLAVAEINTILSQWPISFFNRALLSGIGFYSFWQLMEIREEQGAGKIVSHFLFVTLTVMVVLGSIIWANFPQLTPF